MPGQADAHSHGGFEVPVDSVDRPVNRELLGQFVGAAFDSCTSCQDALLTLLVEDPVTTARLVELACVATQMEFGGLPGSLTDEHRPGPASPEFRRLAREGLNGITTMFTLCEQMSPAQRRAAANTGADILLGHLILARQEA